MCTERINRWFGESRKARLGFGLCVLLVVDIIWVASAEVTKFIFSKQHFDKPFFSVYLKTAVFASYLLGFIFYSPWQHQCQSFCSGEQKRKEKDQNHRGTSPDTILPPTGDLQSDCSLSNSLTILHNGIMSESIYEQMTDDDDVSSIVTNEEINTPEHDSSPQKHVRFRRVREIRRLNAVSQSSLMTTVDQFDEDSNSNKMSLFETAKLALLFSLPWLAANLFYQEALSFTSAAVTNILSSTSGLFTLILAAIFKSSPLDNLTLSKLLAVLVSLSGIIIVTWSDSAVKKNTIDQGALFALAGAFFYAVYLILLKRRAGEDDRLDIPLFFGFVGIFGAVLFWPGFFILHYAKVEKFELPHDSTTWLFLIGNGVIGTALSELLWVWGCFLTSSLIGTLSLSLVMPLTMAFDMLVNEIHFSVLFLVGSLPIFLAFFAVALLASYEDWDPVMDLLMKVCHCTAVRRRKLRDNEEERESLITNEGQTNSGTPESA